jgi:hypothetical protein
MDMQPVQSANVESVGYDPETQELHVQYTSGGLYKYEGVPEETFNELMTSGSVGSYLHANVKGQYPHSKLE